MKCCYKKICSLGVIVLLLSGCVSMPPASLSNQDKDKIKSTHLVVNSTQKQIIVRHGNPLSADLPDPYFPMDSGAIVHSNHGVPVTSLVGLLIVNGFAKNQEESAKKIAYMQDSLGQINFANYLNQELKIKVAKLSWLNVHDQDIIFNMQGDETKNVLASEDDTTLFIGTTYAFNTTFKQVEVAVYVELVQKQPKYSKKASKIIYAKNFFFIDRLPVPNDNINENTGKWFGNDAAMLKATLKEAAVLLSEAIKMDMSRVTPANKEQGEMVKFRSLVLFKQKGRIIKKQEGYNFIETSNEPSLYIVNNNSIHRY